MRWLYNLPTWFLGLLIVTFFLLTALVGLAIIHRRLHRSGAADSIDNGTVGWFFSAVSLLYGLLLGLLTVAAWGSYNQASIIASQEASATAVLYRDLAAYPDAARDALRKQVRNYLTVIITQSWPAQRRGLQSDSETVVLNQFQKRLFSQEGLTNEQLVVYSETIRAYNTLIDLRRQRQEALRGGVPGVLWLVVLLGAVATIGFSYCFVVVSYRLHALLTGALAGMIGLLVFLLVVLDHPFWGEISVSAEPYQLVLSTLIDR
ncbi:DUF4239 domain-containing protein [Spirosoma utsteinense]|uniref:TRAP-type C4-dicarboxylate transport system permease small subunit n=1 Tax=Spirosoma utsteinense TaxID=2585773 RepID=A0ABR6W549_9BACT|nr:DUF4239 domain-containing protein [Spirosoma utsteinense]MBC3789052.1 TRAP-type C4-dicarboxylate transport system permease small subunit [Spirosoma utsteinense]MBC3791111.1 TRAP-type C4-dicarboxylate transport system permease small subunit [Spirosoma utsteinense]